MPADAHGHRSAVPVAFGSEAVEHAVALIEGLKEGFAVRSCAVAVECQRGAGQSFKHVVLDDFDRDRAFAGVVGHWRVTGDEQGDASLQGACIGRVHH